MHFLGKPWYQLMVHWALTWPLPLQSLFCSQNFGIPYLRLCQAVPPTLSGTVFDVEQAFAGSCRQTCYNVTRNSARKAFKGTYACQEEAIVRPNARPQTKHYIPCPHVAPSTWRSAAHTVRPPARTKGDTVDGTKGGTKGRQSSPY
jgi:hypothetical protein